MWIIFFGWELALCHLVAGLLLMITIIGIPFGVACWKMIPLSLVPLGRQIVPAPACPGTRTASDLTGRAGADLERLARASRSRSARTTARNHVQP